MSAYISIQVHHGNQPTTLALQVPYSTNWAKRGYECQHNHISSLVQPVWSCKPSKTECELARSGWLNVATTEGQRKSRELETISLNEPFLINVVYAISAAAAFREDKSAQFCSSFPGSSLVSLWTSDVTVIQPKPRNGYSEHAHTVGMRVKENRNQGWLCHCLPNGNVWNGTFNWNKALSGSESEYCITQHQCLHKHTSLNKTRLIQFSPSNMLKWLAGHEDAFVYCALSQWP